MLSALLAVDTLLARPLPITVEVFIILEAFTTNGKGLFIAILV